MDKALHDKRDAILADNGVVVCVGNLITNRRPRDLPAFCKKMVEVFQKAGQKITTCER